MGIIKISTPCFLCKHFDKSFADKEECNFYEVCLIGEQGYYDCDEYESGE